MPTVECTIQYLNTNKKNPKFGYFKTSEGDIYGCKAEQLKQFSTGGVYTIQYHVNDRGYNEFDAIVKQSNLPLPRAQRASTSDTDAMHIYVNGKLAAYIAHGDIPLAMTDLLEATDLLVDVYYRSKLSGQSQQQADDLDDRIPY